MKSPTAISAPLPHDHYFTAQDGLKLYVAEYGHEYAGKALPILCLPGLTRTIVDFEDLAQYLSTQHQRQVFSFDYRGRGNSDWDKNPENYNLLVEAQDVVTCLAALKIERAISIGTSRGGLITSILGALMPNLQERVVLNDIGPVIETIGIRRIQSYVGKMVSPNSFQDGADKLKRNLRDFFPALDSSDWLHFAKMTWRMRDGHLQMAYDPALAVAAAALEPNQDIPPLWPQFETIAALPILIIRGEFSDILSAETANAMLAHYKHSRLLEVKGQGHAPLLRDAASMKAIADFIAG